MLGGALVLEYALGVAAVSTGWSAYFANLIAPSSNCRLPCRGAYNPEQGTHVSGSGNHCISDWFNVTWRYEGIKANSKCHGFVESRDYHYFYCGGVLLC